MYVKRVLGKVVRIKDKYMEELLDRFDLNKFDILNTSGTGKAYRNKTECSFCEEHYYKSCQGCPFKQFEEEYNGDIRYGCSVMLENLSPTLGLNDVTFTSDHVTLHDDSGQKNAAMKGTILELQDFFKNFPYKD